MRRHTHTHTHTNTITNTCTPKEHNVYYIGNRNYREYKNISKARYAPPPPPSPPLSPHTRYKHTVNHLGDNIGYTRRAEAKGKEPITRQTTSPHKRKLGSPNELTVSNMQYGVGGLSRQSHPSPLWTWISTHKQKSTVINKCTSMQETREHQIPTIHMDIQVCVTMSWCTLFKSYDHDLCTHDLRLCIQRP